MCCHGVGRGISSLLHSLSQENSKVTFLFKNLSDFSITVQAARGRAEGKV